MGWSQDQPLFQESPSGDEVGVCGKHSRNRVTNAKGGGMRERERLSTVIQSLLRIYTGVTSAFGNTITILGPLIRVTPV